MTNIPTGILIPSRWVMLRVPGPQMTDNAKFSQGVSVFGAEDTTVNSESALNVAINAHFALKVAYNVTRNSEPPASAPEHTDRRTSLSLGYKM